MVLGLLYWVISIDSLKGISTDSCSPAPAHKEQNKLFCKNIEGQNWSSYIFTHTQRQEPIIGSQRDECVLRRVKIGNI